MARGHAMPLAIIQQPREQARAQPSLSRRAFDGVVGQLRLDLLPQGLIDDRLVFPGIVLILVHDLAAVDPVAQHRVQRTPGERLAAPAAACRADPGFAANA